ncbi:Uncharacterized protein TCM_045230 [Theobroma cacao]|uniref:Uncharacterized protein n=1 Tax=Theobroma cacao TaxID=3641 RepID=A0A061FSH7_THECC|nr:Uncharacterized protein TCM_045230 [Theobroma cacao]
METNNRRFRSKGLTLHSDAAIEKVDGTTRVGAVFIIRRPNGGFLCAARRKMKCCESVEEAELRALVCPTGFTMISALQAAELRISARDEVSGEKALLAKNKSKENFEVFTRKNFKEKEKKATQSSQSSNRKGRLKLCSYSKKRNHTNEHCWLKPDAKCKICSQLGHIDRVCKNKAIEDKSAQPNENSELTEEVLITAQTNLESDIKNSEWLLDSSNSRHITPFEAVFVDLDKNYQSKVKIGHGIYLHAYCKGKVHMQTSTGHSMLCQLGKISKKPFPSVSYSQAKCKLELLHFDVGGPISEESLNGSMEVSIPLMNSHNFLNKKGYSVNLLLLTLLSKMEPSVAHLKVFGCVCYVHIPKSLRDTLHQKVESGVFIGFNTQAKAYEPQPVTFIHHIQTFTAKDQVEIERDENIDDQLVMGTRSVIEEPSCYAKASWGPVWSKAMQEELQIIHKNGTWSLVDRPANRNTIGVKWIFKKELNPYGSLNKCKARLMAKGYS